jgi:5-methylcytosine-specific restriction protein A
MTVIDDLKPAHPARVIDLVAAAGHDVSDWKNFEGGSRKEASNPKYCYEWAFTQPGKAVVLNLWHEELQEVCGHVVQQLNYRTHAARLPRTAARGTWAKRAKAMDNAFALAATRALPVRVIVCDGKRRDVVKDPEKSSTVSKRVLDPIPWAVSIYDFATGDCTLIRGQAPLAVEDQFSTSDAAPQLPARRPTSGSAFVRDSAVRRRVMERAKGFCEYCSERGFLMSSGAAYVETHHIVALGEQGTDNELNIIALCPNDHRRAHHGTNAVSMRKEFQRIVAAKVKLAR